MSQTTAYLNGQFLPLTEAKISPLDRGVSFGDGIYEMIPVFNGKLFCLEEHLDRLNQSLNDIRMSLPHTHIEWRNILETLVKKNGSKDQWLYLLVTRGVDPVREPLFPLHQNPTIFAVSYPKVYPSKETQAKGVRVTNVQDIRWKLCTIKTTARIANVLMFQEAKEKGFDEAIIINEGYAWEGTSSNFFVVRDNTIFTPPKSNYLLSGVTRDQILAIAKKNNIPCQETKILAEDLLTADELWITGSIRGIVPVIAFNQHPIGKGIAGPLWSKMWDLYVKEINQFSLSFSH